MRQDQTRNSRPLLLTALTAVALCTLGLQTAQGASADRAGPISRRAVAAAMPAHAAQFTNCLATTRKLGRFEGAHLHVSYLVKADGTVADIAIPEATPYNPVLENCVKGVVATFRFASSGRPVVVTAPLVFPADGSPS